VLFDGRRWNTSLCEVPSSPLQVERSRLERIKALDLFAPPKLKGHSSTKKTLPERSAQKFCAERDQKAFRGNGTNVDHKIRTPSSTITNKQTSNTNHNPRVLFPQNHTTRSPESTRKQKIRVTTSIPKHTPKRKAEAAIDHVLRNSPTITEPYRPWPQGD
jgi:hypothetical protein